MSSAESIIDRLLSAYHTHDVQALEPLYAPDAVIRVGELEFHGRSGIAEFWSNWFAAFPDVGSEVHRTIIQDERFVLDWTERGTHSRRLRMGDFTIPARGRSLSWRGVSVYELSDGEIARVDYFIDRLALAEQLIKPLATATSLWQRLGRATDSIPHRRRSVGHNEPPPAMDRD